MWQFREEVDPPPIPSSNSRRARGRVRVRPGFWQLACQQNLRRVTPREPLDWLALMAPMNEATYEALLERHPPPHPDAFIPPIEEASQHHSVTVAVEEVLQAIRSFPKASAGGPDGLGSHPPSTIHVSVNARPHQLCQAPPAMPGPTSYARLTGRWGLLLVMGQ